MTDDFLALRLPGLVLMVNLRDAKLAITSGGPTARPFPATEMSLAELEQLLREALTPDAEPAEPAPPAPF